MYNVLNGRQVGWLNSQITNLPPGLVTLSISLSALSKSTVLRNPKEIVTKSNWPLLNGRFKASAFVNGKYGCRALPASNMPSEKSAGITFAPALASGTEDEPVPAANLESAYRILDQ